MKKIEIFLKENKAMFINAMQWAGVPAAMLFSVVLEYYGFIIKIWTLCRNQEYSCNPDISIMNVELLKFRNG